MDERERLAERSEEHRARLRAVAYRMLGSPSEADDAVQETWRRLNRSGGVENLGGWLTTVVARVCLDVLRARRSRREEPFEERPDEHLPGSVAHRGDAVDPEHEALVADSVGPALLAVFDTLTPAERVAFVLHDVFGVPFGEIAPVVERSPNATKMLARRAQRRVRGGAVAPEADPARHQEVVRAFLAAARAWRLRHAAGGARPGRRAPGRPRGLAGGRVGGGARRAGRRRTFSGRARAARPALVDGSAGAVWAPGGQPRVVFDFTIRRGKIVEIDVLADPERLRQLDLALLDD